MSKILNLKRTSLRVTLAIAGAAYLTTVSSLDINILVKPYAAIVPVQLLSLVYAVYLIYGKKNRNK